MYIHLQLGQIEQKLNNLSSYYLASRCMKRLFIGHETENDINRKDRILISPLLQDIPI